MIDVNLWWGVGGVLMVGSCWGGVLVRVEIEYIGCLWFEFNSSVKGRDDIFFR